MKIKKIYENESIFDVGDYIVIEYNKIKTKEFSKPYKNFALIIEKSLTSNTYLYDFKFLDLVTSNFNNSSMCYIADDDIERKMTPKEIEDFKIKIESSKYNLL